MRIHTYDDGSTQGARAFVTRVGWPMVAAGSLCTIGSAQAADAALVLELFGSISLFHTAHSQDSMEVNHLLFRALSRTHTHVECNAKPSMVLRALTRAIFFSHTLSLSHPTFRIQWRSIMVLCSFSRIRLQNEMQIKYGAARPHAHTLSHTPTTRRIKWKPIICSFARSLSRIHM